MGSCFGKCLTWKRNFRIFKNHRSHIARFRESSSIIEFESLIGEDEQSIYPQSVVLPHERILAHTGKLDVLSDAQIILSKLLNEEMRRNEEALEFEEEYFINEDVSETGSMEIINPRELLSKNCDTLRNNDNSLADEEDFDVFLERIRNKTLNQKDQLLILNPGSLLKNDGSTTHSSVELDWESEGLTYPQEVSGNTDDDPTTNKTETTSIRSRQDSNSLSNDFEWDEDIFLDSQLPSRQTLDNETEILLDEIEQLTSRALNETGPNR